MNDTYEVLKDDFINTKYELLKDDFIQHNGRRLYRIRALRDWGGVRAGDLGGYLEQEYNLSPVGACWVYHNAKVYGGARVSDCALVHSDAQVYGGAQVCCDAQVGGDARVCGDAQVGGDVQLCEGVWTTGIITEATLKSDQQRSAA